MTTDQMLLNNLLDYLRRAPAVPNAFRVHHHNGAATTDTQAGRFGPLHARGTEEQLFAFQQRRQLAVKRTSASLNRAKPARADEHVAAVGLHLRERRLRA